MPRVTSETPPSPGRRGTSARRPSGSRRPCTALATTASSPSYRDCTREGRVGLRGRGANRWPAGTASTWRGSSGWRSKRRRRDRVARCRRRRGAVPRHRRDHRTPPRRAVAASRPRRRRALRLPGPIRAGGQPDLERPTRERLGWQPVEAGRWRISTRATTSLNGSARVGLPRRRPRSAGPGGSQPRCGAFEPGPRDERRSQSDGMKIAIVGTGAMGSVYAGVLGRAGHEVWAIDTWQQHIDAIAGSGLAGGGSQRRLRRRGLHVGRVPADAGSCDVWVIATKAADVDAAAAAVAPLLRPGDMVMAFQNGLGAGERVPRADPRGTHCDRHRRRLRFLHSRTGARARPRHAAHPFRRNERRTDAACAGHGAAVARTLASTSRPSRTSTA